MSLSVSQTRPLRKIACSATYQSPQTAFRTARSPDHVPEPRGRRACLAGAAAGALALLPLRAGVASAADEPSTSSSTAAPGVEVLEDNAGSGTATARQGDLVLVHYVGTTEGGTLFDSTRGGQMYRDGGLGALRPVVIQLGGAPVPGICEGLQRGILGMRVGGRRTFSVPPSLGFGNSTALGPYGIVPAASTLRYEVELVRLSRQGPDALMSGISQCGGGFVNERTAGCADITVAEFV